MTRNRLLLAGLFLLVPAIVVAGFFYDVIFAGTPFQDPTSKRQARYLLHSTIVGHLEYAGLIWFTGFGIVWIGYKCLKKQGPSTEGHSQYTLAFDVAFSGDEIEGKGSKREQG